ncbi:unnamed protein product [Coregonus sp. 'balchen']|nr:unnamed protein product [Coregonus sp. 'balchen']
MAEDKDSAEAIVAEVHKKISGAFDVFDHEFNKTVDVRFRPIPEDLLLQAFEVLDKQKKGHLELEELTKYMTQEGEPFTQEEMEEMLSAALDPDKNVIFYKDFVSMMTVDDPR